MGCSHERTISRSAQSDRVNATSVAAETPLHNGREKQTQKQADRQMQTHLLTTRQRVTLQAWNCARLNNVKGPVHRQRSYAKGNFSLADRWRPATHVAFFDLHRWRHGRFVDGIPSLAVLINFAEVQSKHGLATGGGHQPEHDSDQYEMPGISLRAHTLYRYDIRESQSRRCGAIGLLVLKALQLSNRFEGYQCCIWSGSQASRSKLGPRDKPSCWCCISEDTEHHPVNAASRLPQLNVMCSQKLCCLMHAVYIANKSR